MSVDLYWKIETILDYFSDHSDQDIYSKVDASPVDLAITLNRGFSVLPEIQPLKLGKWESAIILPILSK